MELWEDTKAVRAVVLVIQIAAYLAAWAIGMTLVIVAVAAVKWAWVYLFG